MFSSFVEFYLLHVDCSYLFLHYCQSLNACVSLRQICFLQLSSQRFILPAMFCPSTMFRTQCLQAEHHDSLEGSADDKYGKKKSRRADTLTPSVASRPMPQPRPKRTDKVAAAISCCFVLTRFFLSSASF